MTRDQQVAAVANILPYHWRTNPPGGTCSCGHETPLGRQTSEHVAKLVVDAVTPLIATPEEACALPVGALVVNAKGQPFRRREQYADDDSWPFADEYLCIADLGEVLEHGPVTVVWQPEVQS